MLMLRSARTALKRSQAAAAFTKRRSQRFRPLCPDFEPPKAFDSSNRLGKFGSRSIHLGRGPQTPGGADAMTAFVSLHVKSRGAAMALAAGLILSMLPAVAQTPPPKKDDFQISAPYAILIDADSGTVLFEKNADKLNPPASMSKLMTTELVLHTIAQGKLKWEDEMTISENAWRRGGAPSGGSAMFAALNSRLSVRNLLQGVMIQSGNDACIALAEGIAGSELAFADMMNKRAKELGLTQANFTNSTGMHDPDHNIT